MTAPDGYVSQSQDTSPEIDRLLMDKLRELTPGDRLRLLSEQQIGAEQLAIAGIRQRHPGAAEREVQLRLAALRYGRDFAVGFCGWDPDEHGW